MSDEMKLLKALCEALGFLVEVETDYQEYYMSAGESVSENRCFQINSDGRFARNSEDLRLSRLKKPILSYKLIKKEDIEPLNGITTGPLKWEFSKDRENLEKEIKAELKKDKVK